MKPEEYNNQGNVSQWNEGNLKSLRLHEAQELINLSKMNPLKKVNGSWNFQMWIEGINILFGEGYSKYSDDEKKYVTKEKEILDLILERFPIIKFYVPHSFEDPEETEVQIDYDNWKRVKKKIEFFEEIVKKFNDEHGLSTRNVDFEEDAY